MSDVTEFRRDHYYRALREYGLPHHLAETIVDEFGHACDAMMVGAQINEQLRAENARLKAELAAIKARRCETCKYGRRISDIAYECKRTHANLVMWAHDGCSRWEQSKKKREAADA